MPEYAKPASFFRGLIGRVWSRKKTPVTFEPEATAEMFSAERLEQHGRQVAMRHRIAPHSSSNRLLERLDENAAILDNAYKTLTDMTLTRGPEDLPPAATWLLDNYYLIEGQIRSERNNLPKGYNKQLPQLADGNSAGLPRVYDIALEITAHGDGRVDSERLTRFVASYQTVSPLAIGELWAVPIMLRLAIIEKIRGIAARMVAGLHDREQAAAWAERLIGTVEKDSKNVIVALADLTKAEPPLTSAFVSEFSRRLQGQGPALVQPLTWMEQVLAENGLGIEQMVRQETQRQAADQVSIGNSVTTLRLLSTLDWRKFVESLSVIERVLGEDPGGCYTSMAFVSRDMYRHVVEALAKIYSKSEEEVAREALSLARDSAGRMPGGVKGQRSHVGYYLIGGGRDELVEHIAPDGSLSWEMRWLRSWVRKAKRTRLSLYLATVAVVSLLAAWPFFVMTRHSGFSWPVLIAVAIAALLVGSRFALSFVNWVSALLFKPRIPPRMDFGNGIPAEARTAVVVPCLFSGAEDVDHLVEGLEVRYLANRGDNLHFGLLSDFTDADAETLPGDEELLRIAREGIAGLNAKYPGQGCDRFFLCHRPRQWNQGENTWMGHERKRGKLEDFNALLRGNGRDRFMLLAGGLVERPDSPEAGQTRYVITLDADTQLPGDTARKLVGAMAHPLNRPIHDPKTGVVVSGHAIMQPRVGTSISAHAGSFYTQLFGGDAGVDPYTRAVSDTYQDVFGEGSFIGKGIYDVDAFEKALGGRFPDNRILSHDLIEGGYARSGLIADVQLYEEYPSRYGSDVKRRHRWIRGDWQLLPWLMPRVPTGNGGPEQNPLSLLSKWKIFDNLRRSLVPAATMALLIFGWAAVELHITWTLAVFALLLVPQAMAAIRDTFRKRNGAPLSRHLLVTAAAFGDHALRALLEVVWLPHETVYTLDAIFRTLWNMLVSKRHLLQWDPSLRNDRAVSETIARRYAVMWMCPAVAVCMIGLLWRNYTALAVASPFLVSWLVSPWIAWRVSRPAGGETFVPSPDEVRFLRTLARKTWAFFERYVNQDESWLPPDNMQEQPVAAVAHRTSPTNMGLSLLVHLAAHDFGYLGAGALLERLGHSLYTMSLLPRHQGHFFNWYDTHTLAPLYPRYISTVDSGNLAGHLLTLRSGLQELPDEPVWDVRFLHGLADTAEAVRGAFSAVGMDGAPWRAFQKELAEALAGPPATAGEALARLRQLLAHAERLEELIYAKKDAESDFWLKALIRQCRDVVVGAATVALPPGAVAAVPELASPSWKQLAEMDVTVLPEAVREQADAVKGRAAKVLADAARLADAAGKMSEMDFTFLYDKRRDLFSIGFNLETNRLDSGFYDLLASEARLASFVTIAMGQIPQRSWFTLGRLLTSDGGEPVLLSWSGSMFEYLMPMLVMPDYQGTLLSETCKAAVDRQIELGRRTRRPWGISESGYNAFDANLNYQYRAFGCPGLGLRRGLDDDGVVAPYATMLALLVSPEAATRNLERLAGEGMGGRYGMYEAVDYTPARVPPGWERVVVRSYMAHHQGMGFLSLASALLGQPMQRRFWGEPRFRAISLLLQERVPKSIPEFLHTAKPSAAGLDAAAQRANDDKMCVFTDPDRRQPAVQLLSNGNYHVMVTNAGGGYSRYRDMAVTRWREDATRDNWGMFFYLRDMESGDFWSVAHQPVGKDLKGSEAIFSDGRAEFRVHAHDCDVHSEIVVSPEDDSELRRVNVANRGRERRTLEITTYAEVVLAPAIADESHPSFSNLFAQTELVPELQAIFCTRRPRTEGEKPLWLFHMVAVHNADLEEISYETDRARFIGRNRDLSRPRVMDRQGDSRLSNTAGPVLDPIVAIRCRFTLNPGQRAVFDFATGVGWTRDECLRQTRKYRDRHLADRVLALSWTQSQVQLQQLNASPSDARLYEEMASSIIFANNALRAPPRVLAANRRNQSGLWGHGISGDLPIVLAKMSDAENIEMVRRLVQAHAYWTMKGLAVDLVIWSDEREGYRKELHDQIVALIPPGSETRILDQPGGIFVRALRNLSHEDRGLMEAVARIVVDDEQGPLSEQITRRRVETPLPPPGKAWRGSGRTMRRRRSQRIAAPPAKELTLANPYGGFSPSGDEYVITMKPGMTTPAPWANILANPGFGSVVSESGGAYTWSENAHEFRLTPWANDPLTDASGEAFYLRDEESGRCWSPMPSPMRGRGEYRVRHGFGYSVFEHHEGGIASEMWVFVPVDSPVKIALLRLHNVSPERRRLSATGYAEWVLGDLRSKTAMHVVTSHDPLAGVVFAQNAYSMEFQGRTAFFSTSAASSRVSGDRREFIGRNGSLSSPSAVGRARLSGRVGAGLDPCAAIQTELILESGGTRELVFCLGAAGDAGAAADLAKRFRSVEAAHEALEAVRAHWRETLGAVRVETPDPSVDVLANGWLLYQVIACRFWARSGYYQSGGAFGFRDQLQDSLAMIHSMPGAVRAHILLSASRQFPEGDVQHWWHPPANRGVRTRCSDDFLWLPLAVGRYVRITGDTGILDEEIGYIEGRKLNEGEESYYDLPAASTLRETLYRHCQRAIEHGMAKGVHGLPLMWCGDWNDGMNRVGEKGRGESVWLGFFLHEVLGEFSAIARARGDEAFVERCDAAAVELRANLEAHAWDGGWYRRAYFDDGTPLGSATGEECKIDSIAQSWSVLSGAAPDGRRREAMQALYDHLVVHDPGLIRLLTPPFDKSLPEPGYIKGYLPGVRENGGQYTHAAVWSIMAFAALGEAERAWELLGLINPVRHGEGAESVEVYKVEPYVVAADVYAVPPHTGRGGWSWYTGSAGWLYRLLVESLLGLHVEGETLFIKPVVPGAWRGFTMRYRFRTATYVIAVRRGDAPEVKVDGATAEGGAVRLLDDGREHHVEVVIV